MRKILWSPDPTAEIRANPLANISRPTVLISGAAPPLLALWLERNPWASAIPLVILYDVGAGADAEMLAWNHERIRTGGSGSIAMHFLEGDAPFRRVAGPSDLLRVIEHRRSILDRLSAVKRTIKVAQLVAQRAGPGVPWEVMGEASDGTIGVGACMAWERAAIVAANAPGPLFATACQRERISTVGTLHALAA